LFVVRHVGTAQLDSLDTQACLDSLDTMNVTRRDELSEMLAISGHIRIWIWCTSNSNQSLYLLNFLLTYLLTCAIADGTGEVDIGDADGSDYDQADDHDGGNADSHEHHMAPIVLSSPGLLAG